jgi:hypothetical protein
MDLDRKLLGALLAGSLLLGAAACSDGDDDAKKDPADAAVDEAEVTQEVTVDADGNVTVTDSEGNVDEFQTSTEVPDGWPEGLEPPESVTIISSNTTEEGKVTSLFITATSDTPIPELVEQIRGQLTAAGFLVLAETVNETESGGTSANLSAQQGQTGFSLSMASEAEGPASVLYSVTIDETPQDEDEPEAESDGEGEAESDADPEADGGN